MSNQGVRYKLIAAIAVLLLLVILHTSQPTGPIPDETKSPTPTTAPSATATPEPRSFGEEVAFSCKRPYEDSSIWNLPLDWSIAKIHPMSDLMMQAFFENDDWIGSDTSQFAPNIYWVDNDTPLVPVRLAENRFRDALEDQAVLFSEPAASVQIPLPAEALPAKGSDGQLVVINVDTGEEWGLNEGDVDSDGSWEASGAYRYHIENSGIPPEGFGQRGAGIGQLAGIVRRCEVDRGRIDHAVTLAYDYPCAPKVCQLNGWPAQIPPFRKTDGRGDSQYDIPEGTRIAVRPEISRAEIKEVCSDVKGCVAWLLAMQEYGGFIVDRSGHPKTYAEGDATARWDESLWTENMLRDVPMDWYVVIDWNTPSTRSGK
jgi:hypothetical protein